jgi:hypothetical protein
MLSFLWCLIKLQKARLRIKLAWIDFWRWGARERLREIAAWERREIQDLWRETSKKWRAPRAAAIRSYEEI